MSLPSQARHLVGMPTALRLGPYRFFFYAGDSAEPAHVHVRREDSEAKFWLDPVSLERNRGFSARELKRIERLVADRAEELKQAWHDYFET